MRDDSCLRAVQNKLAISGRSHAIPAEYSRVRGYVQGVSVSFSERRTRSSTERRRKRSKVGERCQPLTHVSQRRLAPPAGTHTGARSQRDRERFIFFGPAARADVYARRGRRAARCSGFLGRDFGDLCG